MEQLEVVSLVFDPPPEKFRNYAATFFSLYWVRNARAILHPGYKKETLPGIVEYGATSLRSVHELHASVSMTTISESETTPSRILSGTSAPVSILSTSFTPRILTFNSGGAWVERLNATQEDESLCSLSNVIEEGGCCIVAIGGMMSCLARGFEGTIDRRDSWSYYEPNPTREDGCVYTDSERTRGDTSASQLGCVTFNCSWEIAEGRLMSLAHHLKTAQGFYMLLSPSALRLHCQYDHSCGDYLKFYDSDKNKTDREKTPMHHIASLIGSSISDPSRQASQPPQVPDVGMAEMVGGSTRAISDTFSTGDSVLTFATVWGSVVFVLAFAVRAFVVFLV